MAPETAGPLDAADRRHELGWAAARRTEEMGDMGIGNVVFARSGRNVAGARQTGDPGSVRQTTRFSG
jgi:hypothetical protein